MAASLIRLIGFGLKSPESNIESVFRDSSDRDRGANREVSNLAFLSVAAATNELKHLREAHPEKYGHMSLDQIRQVKLSEDVAHRDGMGLMGAAMCSPLFLFGIGAAFAVMDDVRAGKEAKLQRVLRGQAAPGDIANGGKPVAKGESVEETTEKQERVIARRLSPEAIKMLGLDKMKKAGAEKSFLKYGIKKASQPDTSERVKQKLFTGVDKSWEERAAQRSLKNWIKSDKLVKQKQVITDQMEKLRGRDGQFNLVAGLASRLEVVEKALKRLGV